MRLLHPTEGLAVPNVCALCNTAPNRENGKRVVDTGFTRVAPRADVIYRNYVCESCGTEIGNKLGMVSNEQAKAAFHAAKSATERLDSVRTQVQAAAEEILAFSKDVVLGNERAAVDRWVEGDYIETVESAAKQTVPEATKKPVGRPRKPDSGSLPAPVSSGSANS